MAGLYKQCKDHVYLPQRFVSSRKVIKHFKRGNCWAFSIIVAHAEDCCLINGAHRHKLSIFQET